MGEDKNKPLFEEIVPGRIWCREYPVKVKGIVGFAARCTIVRLNNGMLWVHSPCPIISEQLKSDVNALGPVGYIIAPSNRHYLHVKAWQEAYPTAKTYLAPELALRQPSLKYDGTLTDRPEAPWAEELAEQLIVYAKPQNQRNRMVEVEFYDRHSKTLIVVDLIFNITNKSPNVNFPTKALLKISKEFGHATVSGFGLFKERDLVKAATDRMLEFPLDRIIVGHGDNILSDAKTVLQWAVDAYSAKHKKK